MPAPLRKPFKPIDPEFDPTKITCEVFDCPMHGRKQDVVGAYDQPPHFAADPSRIYLLACGHEVF